MDFARIEHPSRHRLSDKDFAHRSAPPHNADDVNLHHNLYLCDQQKQKKTKVMSQVQKRLSWILQILVLPIAVQNCRQSIFTNYQSTNASRGALCPVANWPWFHLERYFLE
jgi:hypothetical protein